MGSWTAGEGSGAALGALREWTAARRAASSAVVAGLTTVSIWFALREWRLLLSAASRSWARASEMSLRASSIF
ncbi:hypothetical protein [Stigmatella aurantiaca]|uniref:hypothetical protein n=1 Tax=Stigmatella aurantiaca TaxID=41 RepID=UPI0012F7903B|nr:hypothetical protein [Stigmatella aurantiaca]